MRRSGRSFGAALMLALAAAPGVAAAQLHDSLEPVRYMAPRTFNCFLGREPRLVDAWLRTLPGSSEERDVIKANRVAINFCFGINSDGSRFQQSYDFKRIRNGLVRASLIARRSDLPVALSPALVPATWYRASAASDPANAAALMFNDIGFCLARRNWQGVRNLILAVDPATEGRQAFAPSTEKRELALVRSELGRMVSTLPGCFAQGQPLRLDLFSLRAILEETAWHVLDDRRAVSVASEGVQSPDGKPINEVDLASVQEAAE